MATTESKPTLSALKTPLSATYPSELRSPMVTSASTPTFAAIKKEDSIKTPITPPTAYLEFLKTMSPVLMSPMSAGPSPTFVFHGNRPTSHASLTSAASTGSFTSTSGPAKTSASTPASSRASSCSNCDKDKDKQPEPPKTAPIMTKDTVVTIPPPSPFTRPQSARTPRLYIPQSPYSPATVRSPASANSTNSPYSAVSPKTWDLDNKKAGASSSRTRRVSVREVVTRTVTYSSTPVDTKPPNFPQIDPAPRGKRRKLE